MDRRLLVAAALLAMLGSALLQAQSKWAYAPPLTPWGDPDLQGDFTNSDESLIPMERPGMTGRGLDETSAAELGRLIDERNAARAGARKGRGEADSCLTASMRAHMVDARGRFEGGTLVVGTTNFTDKRPYRGSSERLRLVERFTPLDDRNVEYACHEGNYAMRNLLGVARTEEAAASK